MRGTQIIYAHKDTFELLAEIDKRFSATRHGFWERVQAAWLVFTGQADALAWRGEDSFSSSPIVAEDTKR